MRLAFIASIGVALLVTLSLPAQAQWKWRDKGGQTQYSDIPPPQGTPEANILQRPAAAKSRNAVTIVSNSASAPGSAVAANGAPAVPGASAPGLAAAKTADPELEARIKKVEDDKAAKAKAEEAKLNAQKADNCARARSHLKVLDDGMRISRVNPQGEREVLDDKGRADETGRTKAVIASDCK